jgi:hypothetical protein
MVLDYWILRHLASVIFGAKYYNQQLIKAKKLAIKILLQNKPWTNVEFTTEFMSVSDQTISKLPCIGGPWHVSSVRFTQLVIREENHFSSN